MWARLRQGINKSGACPLCVEHAKSSPRRKNRIYKLESCPTHSQQLELAPENILPLNIAGMHGIQRWERADGNDLNMWEFCPDYLSIAAILWIFEQEERTDLFEKILAVLREGNAHRPRPAKKRKKS